MSLINQVLQDLDRRQVGVAAAAIAPLDLHAARGERRAPRWIFAVAMATAGAALALTLTFGATLVRSRPGELAEAIAASAPVAPAASAIAMTWRTATSIDPPTAAIDSSRSRAGAQLPAPASAPPAAQPSPPWSASSAAQPPSQAAVEPAVPRLLLASTQPSATPSPQDSAPAINGQATAPAAAGAEPGARALPSRARDPVAASTLPPQLDKRAPVPGAAEHAEQAYRGAVDAHRDGRNDAAEAAFARALQEDPRHAAARQALAVLLVGRGRSSAAETLLAEGLAIDAREPSLTITLARIKASRGDVAGAIALLEAQESAPAQALIATLLQGAGRHVEATEHYVLALQLAPANAAWWAAMSVSLAAAGRHDNAREALLRARGSEQVAPELLLWIDQRLRANASARGLASAN